MFILNKTRSWPMRMVNLNKIFRKNLHHQISVQFYSTVTFFFFQQMHQGVRAPHNPHLVMSLLEGQTFSCC